jgi:hypothetical protein
MTAGLPGCLLFFYNDLKARILPSVFFLNTPVYAGFGVNPRDGNVLFRGV